MMVGVLLVALGLCVVGLRVWVWPVDRDARAAAVERKALAQLGRTVASHADALVKRRRQLIGESPDGNTDMGPWRQEAVQFVANVVGPTLDHAQRQAIAKYTPWSLIEYALNAHGADL